MIRVVRAGDDFALSADLDPASLAYVDREWLFGEADAPVPAVVVGPGGQMSWNGRPPVARAGGGDPDSAALAAFAEVARRAAQAATVGTGSGLLEVRGAGLLAELVRRLRPAADPPAALPGGTRSALGAVRRRHRAGIRAPDVVVDTTGCPETIVDATRRLSDLGTLVLGGESLGRALSLDLYPDVHRRGLRLVGLSPPLSGAAPSPDPEIELRSAARPAAVVTGQPLPPAAWYRLSARS